MSIVSWEYYDSLHNNVASDEFPRLEALAEKKVREVIGAIRFDQITEETFGYDVLKDCICNVIDKQTQDARSPKGKGVTSVSNDGYTESYATEVQTQEAQTEEMRGCIRQWLSGTGMVGAY